jgi:membrane protein DedA with SNARE-associated domain
MAGERSLPGVHAGAGPGAGVPGLLGLLLAMEAGVPVPVPSDLVMLLLGERVSAGSMPLWLAMAALELVALAGTAAPFLAARGPGRALVARLVRTGTPGTLPLLGRVPGRGRSGRGRGRRPTAGPDTVAVGPRWGSAADRLRSGDQAVHRVFLTLAAGRTTPGLRTVTVMAAASSGIRVGQALPALVLGSSLFLQAHLLLGYALGPPARELLEQARLPVLLAGAAALAAAVVLLLFRRRGRAARVVAEGACPACLALGLLRGPGAVDNPTGPDPVIG